LALKRLTEAEGRDFSALTISYKAPLYDTAIASPDGSRRPFFGKPADIAGDIRAFAAIGVHELIFDCRGPSITESIERLQWFATASGRAKTAQGAAMPRSACSPSRTSGVAVSAATAPADRVPRSAISSRRSSPAARTADHDGAARRDRAS